MQYNGFLNTNSFTTPVQTRWHGKRFPGPGVDGADPDTPHLTLAWFTTHRVSMYEVTRILIMALQRCVFGCI